MTSMSRRSVIAGMGAGAVLATGGSWGRLVPAVRAAEPKPPGTRPYPGLPEGTDTLPRIEHIVVLMMENHSFDCYFGMLGRGDGYRFDRNGLPVNSCPDGTGRPVHVFHAPSTCQARFNISQSWDVSHLSWDGGRNDGFVTASSTSSMAYWTATDLPFTYDLASHFPICDRYFASVMAQTYPNRRFLIAATALGQVSDPLPGINDPPPPNGTIFDLLNAHGISWKDYFADLPTAGLFPSVLKQNPGKVVPVAEFFADAAAGTLPGFSLVDPEGFEASEEDPQDIKTGQYYVAQVVNAVMHGPAWDRTLLVYTYDEHGGYYDHVAPRPAVRPDRIAPQVAPADTYGDLYTYTGFRVPTVIVSAWAKPRYVSHIAHDHTSILRLVETKWNLPALTYRDANASNLLDCLALTAPEPPFLIPPALAAAPVPSGAPGCFAADPHSPV